jgi:glycosyltransferase involved in cell wall biosynthesis
MGTIHTASHRIQVLQVVGNAIVGGMETYVTRLIERLPPERFGVSLMCPFESRMADRWRELGADVIITPMPENPSWTSIQLACSVIKAHGVDVLHAHLPNAHVLAGIAGKLSGKPVVSTIHGRQISTVDLEVHRTAGTHLSAVCRQTYFHALGLGVQPSQLHFIPNGVDLKDFKPGGARVGALRQRLGIGPDVDLIGFVGRLSPEKGPDVFIRAAVALKQALPKARFVLIGEGPMRADMQSLIERFDLGDVADLCGLMPDMPSVFAELDVVVSSSRSEALPLAIMEAMACGLPVVATRVGGVPDLIQHGVTGWLVGDGDFDAIAVHVRSLIDKPIEREAMGRRARERAEKQLSLDDSVTATMQLLTRLAQQKTSEPRRNGAVVSSGLNGGSTSVVHGMPGVGHGALQEAAGKSA